MTFGLKRKLCAWEIRGSGCQDRKEEGKEWRWPSPGTPDEAAGGPQLAWGCTELLLLRPLPKFGLGLFLTNKIYRKREPETNGLLLPRSLCTLPFPLSRYGPSASFWVDLCPPQ